MQVPMFGTAGFTLSGWTLSCWVDRILQVSRVLPVKFPKKSFYMDAAHVALYFGLVPSWWPMFADAGGRNTGTTQILTSIFRELIKPCYKLVGFIRHEQHLPQQLETAHSYKYLLYEVHLIYPLQVFFLMFELNPYEKKCGNCPPLSEAAAPQEH